MADLVEGEGLEAAERIARHDLPLPGQGHVKRGLLRLLEHCDDGDALGMKHLEINEQVSL